MVFLALMADLARDAAATAPEMAAELERLAGEWGALTLAIGGKAQENADELGAAAVDYLMYCGYCVLAYFWALTAHKAHQQLNGTGKPGTAAEHGADNGRPSDTGHGADNERTGDQNVAGSIDGATDTTELDPFILGKRLTAEFYFQRVLPRTAAHKAAIEAGARPLMSMEPGAFTHH